MSYSKEFELTNGVLSVINMEQALQFASKANPLHGFQKDVDGVIATCIMKPSGSGKPKFECVTEAGEEFSIHMGQYMTGMIPDDGVNVTQRRADLLKGGFSEDELIGAYVVRNEENNEMTIELAEEEVEAPAPVKKNRRGKR